MPSITIRHVPEDVRDDLAARAARSGRSLQEFLLAELTRLAGTTPVEDLLVGVRRRAETSGRTIGRRAILAARDAERR